MSVCRICGGTIAPEHHTSFELCANCFNIRNFRIIAVDFDGTMEDNGWPNIGEPRLNVINKLKEERANGSKLILWTCRAGKFLDDAIEWSRNLGIEFDAVNDNIPEVIEMFGGNGRKVSATEYWDDKSKFF